MTAYAQMTGYTIQNSVDNAKFRLEKPMANLIVPVVGITQFPCTLDQ